MLTNNRFKVWENKLALKDSETAKITDVKQHVSRIEFKDTQPYEKIFDCRVMQRTRPVTKGYYERKKENPTFSVFGAGKGNDNLRMNATITMNMRENIWHPYYEIKVEEEDIGAKYRKNKLEATNKVGDVEINEIQQKIDTLEQAGQQEVKKTAQPNILAPPVKKTFDMERIKREMEEKERVQGQTKVIDPRAIRIEVLPQSITEEEVKEVMEEKFGQVDRVRIPLDEQRGGRNRGFAIVAFKSIQTATRAIDEQEVNIGMASMSIKEAYQSQAPRGGGRDREGFPVDRSAFQQLQRGGRRMM